MNVYKYWLDVIKLFDLIVKFMDVVEMYLKKYFFFLIILVVFLCKIKWCRKCIKFYGEEVNV